MSNQALRWKITPAEQKGRGRRTLFFLLSSLPILVGIIIGGILSADVKFSLEDYLYALLYGALIVAGTIFLLLGLNEVFPYRRRSYRLDDQGITVWRGNKKKNYTWSNFECFYQYAGQRGHTVPSWCSDRYISAGEIKRVKKIEKEFRGRIFYLKRKSKGLLSQLYKIFLVVYAEPNNSEVVESFLKEHVSEEEMRAGTDLGLVIYQFK